MSSWLKRLQFSVQKGPMSFFLGGGLYKRRFCPQAKSPGNLPAKKDQPEKNRVFDHDCLSRRRSSTPSTTPCQTRSLRNVTTRWTSIGRSGPSWPTTCRKFSTILCMSPMSRLNKYTVMTRSTFVTQISVVQRSLTRYRAATNSLWWYSPVFICQRTMSDGILQTFDNKRRFLKVRSHKHAEK